MGQEIEISNEIQPTQTALAGQALVFGLLGKLLYVYPDRAWLQSLLVEDLFDDIPFGMENPVVANGLGLLQSWYAACQAKDLDETLENLRLDYTHLFVGPGKVLVPPFESIYFNNERLIFQEETLQVRGWYRRFGLVTENLYKEPDDHAGLELAFLAHLAQLASVAADDQDTARLDEIIDAQRQFFSAHAGRWIPAWCDLVISNAQTDFYRGVALTTKGALAELASMLGVRLASETKK